MGGVMRPGDGTSGRVQESRPLGGFLVKGHHIMDKPFRTIDEQVSILQGRGLDVTGAERVLSREGYYSVVNGYKDIFIDKARTAEAGQDMYQEGASFADLYRLFTFDRDLRLTMFRYFAEAEAALKTQCAYWISEAHKDEPERYLDPRAYRQERHYRDRVSRFIEDLKKILNKPPYEDHGFKREYIEFYVKEHGEVPLWVLTNYLMMGQAFRLFEFQPEPTRNAIAMGFSGLYESSYGKALKISQRRLRLAYDHIKDFRNICAHDERLYCARVAPSSDISLVDLFKDMELVLSKDEYDKMREDVMWLLISLMKDLDADHAAAVAIGMGVRDFLETFTR